MFIEFGIEAIGAAIPFCVVKLDGKFCIVEPIYPCGRFLNGRLKAPRNRPMFLSCPGWVGGVGFKPAPTPG